VSDRRFIGVMVLSVIALAGFVVGLVILVRGWQCDQIMDTANVITQYRFPSGCFVFVDSSWVPLERWLYLTGG